MSIFAAMESEIRLKGFVISKQSLTDRFSVELTDIEWKEFSKNLMESWGAMEFGLEGMIVKHVTSSLAKSGFRPTLKDNKLIYEKQFT